VNTGDWRNYIESDA